MPKFNVDFTKLENQLTKKAYKLDQVKDRLEIVAFDIVRFKDEDKGANLWQVQSADDGDYIVALYQPEEQEKTAWDVAVNKITGTLQVSYKGDPIVQVNSKRLGITRAELEKVPTYLPTKLADSKKLVKSLLNELTPAVKAQVLNKYPELA